MARARLRKASLKRIRRTWITNQRLERSGNNSTGRDPTRTTTLRNAAVREAGKHFAALRRAIRRKVVQEDFFEGKPPSSPFRGLEADPALVVNFEYTHKAEKMEDFNAWLQDQYDKGLLTPVEGPEGNRGGGTFIDGYVDSAYKQGRRRALDELKKRSPDVDYASYSDDGSAGFGFNFLAPVHLDDLALLYTRNYSALKGITDTMSSRIGQVLAAGLAAGLSPFDIAKDLEKQVGISAERAKTMARTEIIRAHHQGLFRQYKQAGVEKVTFQVEWLAALDDRVCPECASLNGKVFSLDDTQSMIPLHPNCRCCLIPHFGKTFTTPATKVEPVEPAGPVHEPGVLVDDIVGRGEAKVYSLYGSEGERFFAKTPGDLALARKEVAMSEVARAAGAGDSVLSVELRRAALEGKQVDVLVSPFVKGVSLDKMGQQEAMAFLAQISEEEKTRVAAMNYLAGVADRSMSNYLNVGGRLVATDMEIALPSTRYALSPDPILAGFAKRLEIPGAPGLWLPEGDALLDIRVLEDVLNRADDMIAAARKSLGKEFTAEMEAIFRERAAALRALVARGSVSSREMAALRAAIPPRL